MRKSTNMNCVIENLLDILLDPLLDPSIFVLEIIDLS